jgi:hypothetical protein
MVVVQNTGTGTHDGWRKMILPSQKIRDAFLKLPVDFHGWTVHNC